jgi:hypothetical protein
MLEHTLIGSTHLAVIETHLAESMIPQHHSMVSGVGLVVDRRLAKGCGEVKWFTHSSKCDAPVNPWSRGARVLYRLDSGEAVGLMDAVSDDRSMRLLAV